MSDAAPSRFESPASVRERLRAVSYLADEGIAGVVFLAERLGKPILVEGPAEESELLWQGRLETQAPEIDGKVLINDAAEPDRLRAGTFATVEITAAQDYDLIGRLV